MLTLPRYADSACAATPESVSFTRLSAVQQEHKREILVLVQKQLSFDPALQPNDKKSVCTASRPSPGTATVDFRQDSHIIRSMGRLLIEHAIRGDPVHLPDTRQQKLFEEMQ
jgi:hypothetical protein